MADGDESSELNKTLLTEDEATTNLEIKDMREIELVRRCLSVIEERAKKFESQGMTKGNFVFGVANSFFVVWAFGALPGYFWIVYLVEVFLLLPLRWLKMIAARPREHLYWLDFCWMANFGGVIVLLALLTTDVSAATQKWCFCVAWGLGNGPLLGAAALLGNALLFHDFDNTSSVLIHLFPALVMFEMGWNREIVHANFPEIFKYEFFPEIDMWGDIYCKSAFVYGVWWVLYTTWLLTLGCHCPRWGYDTIFHFSMRGISGRAVAKMLRTDKKVLDTYIKTDEYPRSFMITYMCVHAALVLCALPASLLCFASHYIHVGLCAFAVLLSIYNGSSRYTYYMVHSYSADLRRELKIPRDRGASALME
mmetsp:Transcript_49711/g.116082  ORF Transcript_49711/g.116082 Transcript_49711/m.116082 type:complete len:366 (+) Transcript_49711:79-1176(+)